MANPSTTGGSGVGTEVLRRLWVHSNNAAWTSVLTVGSNKIVTILTATWCEQANIAGTCGLAIDTGANDICIFSNQDLGKYETFVWTDKTVLVDGDILKMYNSASNVDLYVSYIEQEFAS